MADLQVRFIASFSVVTSHQAEDRRLFADVLGLPLRPGSGDENAADAEATYVYSEAIPGAKHFGVWPLADAAQACFGRRRWPDSHPVPQASIELEVDDVAAAAAALQERGYDLLHPTRTEPWGQTIARLQTTDGLLVGVCVTPWLGDD